MEYLDGGELFERVAGEDFNLTESDCCQFMKQICRFLLLLLMMLFLQLVSHVTVSVVVSPMILKVMMIVSVGDHL